MVDYRGVDTPIRLIFISLLGLGEGYYLRRGPVLHDLGECVDLLLSRYRRHPEKVQ